MYFKKICISVISVHLLIIGWCFFTGRIPEKKTSEKVVVKTVSLRPDKLRPAPVQKAPAPAPAPEPIAQREPEPEPTPTPKPKPTSKPKPAAKPQPKPEPKKVVKKTTPAPKPQPSKADAKKQELIAKAQSIMKNPGTKSIGSNLTNLGTISKLQIDSPGKVSDTERRYQDILAAHLQDRLVFPEYGEVKIKLTLDKSGKVVKVEVISSKSEENRTYAVKTLPTLLFPSFDSFIKEDKYTFAITLKND